MKRSLKFDEVDAISNILREMVYVPGDELLRSRCSNLGIDWKPLEQIALEIRRMRKERVLIAHYGGIPKCR